MKYVCVIYDLIIDCGLDLLTSLPWDWIPIVFLSNLELKKKLKTMNMLTLQEPFAPYNYRQSLL